MGLCGNFTNVCYSTRWFTDWRKRLVSWLPIPESSFPDVRAYVWRKEPKCVGCRASVDRDIGRKMNLLFPERFVGQFFGGIWVSSRRTSPNVDQHFVATSHKFRPIVERGVIDRGSVLLVHSVQLIPSKPRKAVPQLAAKEKCVHCYKIGRDRWTK